MVKDGDKGEDKGNNIVVDKDEHGVGGDNNNTNKRVGGRNKNKQGLGCRYESEGAYGDKGGQGHITRTTRLWYINIIVSLSNLSTTFH